jgi:transposase
MQVITIGFDLAKNVFQVHGVARDGAAVIRKRLRRARVLEFFADLAPCLVGMEACERASLGSGTHEARPYRQADAAVLCEAVCEAREERCRRRGSDLSELVCQPANISGEILGLAAGQRHVGHLGMRIEQEEGQFARTKAWSSRDALERRNVVAASLLVGRNDMARGAPAPGEFAAMLRIRRMRYRGEARNKNQSGEK